MSKLINIADLFIPIKAIASTGSTIADSFNRQREHVKQLKQIAKQGRERRAANRKNPEIIAEMMISKEELLRQWEIEPEEEGQVRRGLLFEAKLYVLLSIIPVVGVIADMNSYFHWLSFGLFTPYCLFNASTKLWRYECIDYYERLVPFWSWVTGRAYKNNEVTS
jgi:hypothetical protein